jgi:hypothetical protein
MKDTKQIKQLDINNLFLGNLWNNKILDLNHYNKTMSLKIITFGYDYFLWSKLWIKKKKKIQHQDYLNSCFHDQFSHMWFTLLRTSSIHEQFACENEVSIDEQKIIAM